MESRAATPLPEELEVGAGDTEALAEVILEESDERQMDRDAPAGHAVEHRTSADATPPPA